MIPEFDDQNKHIQKNRFKLSENNRILTKLNGNSFHGV